jgi:hypothetical protein
MLITSWSELKMSGQKQVKRRNLTSPKTHGTIFSFSFTLPNSSTERSYVSKEAFEKSGVKVIPEENIGTMEIMKSIRNHLHGTFPLIKEFYGRYDKKHSDISVYSVPRLDKKFPNFVQCWNNLKISNVNLDAELKVVSVPKTNC